MRPRDDRVPAKNKHEAKMHCKFVQLPACYDQTKLRNATTCSHNALKKHLIYRVDTSGNTDTLAQNVARYEERQSICFDEKMRNEVNSHEG